MPIQKTCELCEKSFSVKPSHAAQRFCGDACRSESERLHGRPGAYARTIEFDCQVCGDKFAYKPSYLTAYRKKFGKDPMYCSRKCGGIGRRLSDEDWQITCVQCGKRMPIQRKPGGTINRQKSLCSTECRSLFRRLDYQAKHPDQQPTKRIAKNGYVRIIVPGTNGEPSRHTLEHRYVMEQRLGRLLRPEETVHHKDGNRQHNAPENLELFNNRHGPGQRVTDKVQFAIEVLTLYPDFCRTAGYELRKVGH